MGRRVSWSGEEEVEEGEEEYEDVAYRELPALAESRNGQRGCRHTSEGRKDVNLRPLPGLVLLSSPARPILDVGTSERRMRL